MFGRTIRVSLEKPAKIDNNAELPSQGDPKVSPVIEVTAGIDRIVQTVFKGILVIIAADTARKVIIKSTKEG